MGEDEDIREGLFSNMYRQLHFMRLHCLQQGDHSIDEYMDEDIHEGLFSIMLWYHNRVEEEEKILKDEEISW